MSNRTHFVEIVLTVTPERTECLATEQQVRDEFQSWADSLGATVEVLSVRSEDRSEQS
jgi:hypothetical protein